MQEGEIKARLARVQPGPVQVKLRAKKVVTGVPSSGLWPRATIRFDNQELTVALTEYADPKKKDADGSKLDRLEVAILKLIGVPSRSMRSVKRDGSLKWALLDAAKRVRLRISSAISKAQTTKGLGSRIERVQRKKRRSRAETMMKDTFRRLLQNEVVKFRDLTTSQVGRFWMEVLNEKAVDDVHAL